MQSPTDSQLSSVSARGRILSAYDFAAWHSTDSISDRIPEIKGMGLLVGHRDSAGYVTLFGDLNQSLDTFLVYFRATATRDSGNFRIETFSPAVPSSVLDLARARAIATGLTDFGRPNRPYNTAIIAADSGPILGVSLPGGDSTRDLTIGGRRPVYGQPGRKHDS